MPANKDVTFGFSKNENNFNIGVALPDGAVDANRPNIGGSNLSLDSDKADLILTVLGWSKNTVDTLKRRLEEADCINIMSGDPIKIEYKNSGMGLHSYFIFNRLTSTPVFLYFNIMKKIVGIIYRMFDDRGISSPHFRAIIIVTFILFLHLLHLALIFRIPSYWIMPWDSNSSKSSQQLSAFIYFGVFIALILAAFSKSKFDKITVTQKQIDRAKTILPLYLTACILLLTILFIRHGVEMGTIQL